MNEQTQLYEEALDLLRQMIRIPSFSREEAGTATLLENWLQQRGIPASRAGNNVYARNLHFDDGKPTLLLNSHHDTVKPASGYTTDPFGALIMDGKLYGLGSNDAGASVVCLTAAFRHFYAMPDLPYNLILALTAEEEISGYEGIVALLPLLGRIDCALVGEPTQMQMAVAERGLMVLDVTVKGQSGHAARNEGVNAIYEALTAVTWFRNYHFPAASDLLGPVSMQVTSIHTDNKAHNVVPDTCSFVVDIRINECYTHEAILATVQQHVSGSITPRSTRLRSSNIAAQHPLVQAGAAMGLRSYGSPTLSDKALMPFPALKIGPGDSARSHTADEYIRLDELASGIDQYISLLGRVPHL
ncbi:M20 family metallo-hydrolase [Taibaiella chishuiensis]|uniref:Acetylornithine deacetylase n=1 Tax=Taibaiella chishuiensis TaxID=1434707 RepID=A0A2P8DAM1_9BACT|nr:M20 family metallo-hydrolase [Taibaiella chishuiensis]PSK94255.1 acetylornithine deacetylase [Taibaiella chishuiensis]